MLKHILFGYAVDINSMLLFVYSNKVPLDEESVKMMHFVSCQKHYSQTCSQMFKSSPIIYLVNNTIFGNNCVSVIETLQMAALL